MNSEVRLRVRTVPTLDPVTLEAHTAYMVLCQNDEGGIRFHAPGWTLRDAIENYCNWFKVEPDQIKILRPFLPYRMERYDEFRQ